MFLLTYSKFHFKNPHNDNIINQLIIKHLLQSIAILTHFEINNLTIVSYINNLLFLT